MEHDRARTRAWVLHPDIRTDDTRRAAGPALEEAVALAAALPDLDVIGSDVVPLPRAQAGLLFGSGKIDELKARFADNDVALVLIDGPVSPVQQRNLERAWNVKILDRTGLILEIFSDRARTREGVLQVEMAALSYQRTRLVRAWTHLERQRGGLGFVGGPGETQIEADRRAIDTQIVRLRRQLDKVVKTRSLHRAARAKVQGPRLDHLLKLPPQPGKLFVDSPPVGFNLGFAGAADKAKPAALPFQVGPGTHQAGPLIGQRGHLDLKHTFARAGAVGKDLEDQTRPVQQLHAPVLFEIALLHGADRAVDQDQLDLGRLQPRLQLFGLAGAEQLAGMHLGQRDNLGSDDLQPRQSRGQRDRFFKRRAGGAARRIAANVGVQDIGPGRDLVRRLVSRVSGHSSPS